MHSYRLYPLNNAGCIAGPAFNIDAPDDAEAVRVCLIHIEGAMELWCGSRIVQSFAPHGVLRQA